MQYVMGLAKSHDMCLLSLERASVSHAESAGRLVRDCVELGVGWHRVVYPDRWGVLAKLMALIPSFLRALRVARSSSIEVLHCRGYLGSLIGLCVKRLTGARLIFDMRGFWPDERVDGGVWRRRSLVYRIVKWLEGRLLLGADCVVSLTEAGKVELRGFQCLSGRVAPVEVVPTCVNLELFKPAQRSSEVFTLAYVGSVGTWYLFQEVAVAVRRLFCLREDARFLVINKGGHERVRSMLLAEQVDLSRVEILDLPYDEVGPHLARASAGIFFIKPCWSKKASCPTKMAEFLACGKPCIANEGVGDVAAVLSGAGVGVVVPVLPDGEVDMSRIDDYLLSLFELVSDSESPVRCRSVAESRFSLAEGVARYSRIYNDLSAGRGSR